MIDWRQYSPGCLILSAVILIFGCWLMTLLFALPMITLLKGG